MSKLQNEVKKLIKSITTNEYLISCGFKITIEEYESEWEDGMDESDSERVCDINCENEDGLINFGVVNVGFGFEVDEEEGYMMIQYNDDEYEGDFDFFKFRDSCEVDCDFDY